MVRGHALPGKQGDRFTNDTGRRPPSYQRDGSVVGSFESRRGQIFERQVGLSHSLFLDLAAHWRRCEDIAYDYAFLIVIVSRCHKHGTRSARERSGRNTGLGEEVTLELSLLFRPVRDHLASLDWHIVAKSNGLDRFR